MRSEILLETPGVIVEECLRFDTYNDLEEPAAIDELLTATLTAPTALSCLVSGLSPCPSCFLQAAESSGT